MIDEKLPKRITLDDILNRKRWIIELVDKFGMDIPDDIDGHDFKKVWDRWVDKGGESNYYFAEELRKGLNKYLIEKNKEVNECGVQGQFIKKNLKNGKIKKSKRKRRLEKNSDAEHTPNAPVYDYVDDFRTYAQRTQNNLNG